MSDERISRINGSEEGDLNFEQLSARLEEVVVVLERGDLSLDDSLAAYERGVELVRRCNTLLDEAELKITELSTGIGRNARTPQRDAWSNGSPDDEDVDDDPFDD